MIEFEEALELICANTKTLEKVYIKIADSVDHVLAEQIYSPIYMPPFNKSAMDGFAFNFNKTNQKDTLKINNLIQAGDLVLKDNSSLPNECSKIMTGAAIPLDYNTVIEVEKTNIDKKGKIVNFTSSVTLGRNVCIKGEDIQKGEIVLEKGTLLETSHIALLATVGVSEVLIYKTPSVSIINTGGEIVETGNELAINQIYNSNGPQLQALLKKSNIDANYIGIIKDNEEKIKTAMQKGLQSDLLLVSGGVSMGDYDFVPSIFKSLGVKQIFHKLRIKPGKPLFFGVHDNGVVIGIPGNPVSNFVAYQLFISTTIKLLKGYNKKDALPQFGNATLIKEFKQKSNRKNFAVSYLKKDYNSNNITAQITKSNGSADILALSKSNGVVIVDTSIIKEGEEVKYLTWKKL